MRHPMNVRFCPTVSGPIHLGHLYLCLVNEWEAHHADPPGKFSIRFDDNQRVWRDRLGYEAIRQLESGIIHDLNWMGVQADAVYYQSEMEYDAHKYVTVRCQEAGMPVPVDYYDEQQFPDVVGSSQAYPYTPWKTAEKIAMDRMMEISHLIRGEDLIDEFSLYTYVSDMWRIYQPRHTYLPRLQVKGRELSDVSKTKSNFKLCDLREQGVTPETIRFSLARSCLIDTSERYGGEVWWSIENVKHQPEIDEEDWK